MIEHQSYDILCALAASGRASADDLKQLSDHMAQCADCREQLSDFVQISAQALPFHGDTYERPGVPSGMTKRFRERARAEGLALDGILAVHSESSCRCAVGMECRGCDSRAGGSSCLQERAGIAESWC